ncbi:hypothetical protein FISHEDRAFT_71034 [Fistulina hepatica ATCC 64428]|uniref:Uncharacterized protein n=1 Tax=Fistulina hepatica ATCC 64428 TaxID=1128425 RepID=A0A0D7AH09_9AGAR|nr:hypothetical protein FISHEDRAFT_71034 [Fistulina hepatica ATCC 64428]
MDVVRTPSTDCRRASEPPGATTTRKRKLREKWVGRNCKPPPCVGAPGHDGNLRARHYLSFEVISHTIIIDPSSFFSILLDPSPLDHHLLNPSPSRPPSARRPSPFPLHYFYLDCHPHIAAAQLTVPHTAASGARAAVGHLPFNALFTHPALTFGGGMQPQGPVLPLDSRAVMESKVPCTTYQMSNGSV